MPKPGFTFWLFIVAVFIVCLGLFGACENPINNNNDPENSTRNTLVEFKNLEEFPVTVYRDPGRQSIIARAEGWSTANVKAEPNQIGTPYYITYHITLEGIEIPYNSPDVIVVRVDESKTNTVNIPQLNYISSANAYIKIQNRSLDSLVLINSNTEIRPIGAVSTIIATDENGAYQIIPESASVFSFMKNTYIPVPFPNSLIEFEANNIYSFVFNGYFLELDIISIDINIARMRLRELLSWIDNNAKNGGIYTLNIRTDEEIDPATLSYNDKDVTIILRTNYEGLEVKINLKRNGNLFHIGNNVKLVLNDGIALRGRADNNAPLITVARGGTFTMNAGEVSGNSSTNTGGGVVVHGTFTMNNGKISENSAGVGGGVYVNGTFVMNGGEISGSTASAISPSGLSSGGGVCFTGGICHMSGGVIYGSNAATGLRNTADRGAAFYMEGNAIAQYGSVSGGTFYPSGNLTTTDNTIRVVNGNLLTN
jgi:hypothetical protein